MAPTLLISSVLTNSNVIQRPSCHELIVADGHCPAIATLLQSSTQPRCSIRGHHPLAEISQALASFRRSHGPLQTLHLVAHGRSGAFRIGNHWIDAAALIAHAQLLAAWQVRRIALWSCHLGADRHFLTLLEELTGAQVWASPTSLGRSGNASHWQLLSSHPVEHPPAAPFTDSALQAWPHQLASYTFSTVYAITSTADKEAGLLTFNPTAISGGTTINDGTANQPFSGSDIAATAVIGGSTYHLWISRPIKINGEVVGFYGWSDPQLSSLALAQSDGNRDTDGNPADNNGFIFVVSGKEGLFSAGSISPIADRVDTALNGLLPISVGVGTINTAPDGINVSDVYVNETQGSYAIFKVSGAAGIQTTLALGNSRGLTATDRKASLGTDVGTQLQIFVAGSWVDYNSGLATIPATGTLLVRLAINSDSTHEASESFTLTATTTGGAFDIGVGTINDEGEGAVFLASNTSGNADQNPFGGYAANLDDDRPTLTISSQQSREGSDAEFLVTADRISSFPLYFSPLISATGVGAGHAVIGVDTASTSALQVSTDGGLTWSTVSGPVTLPAGQSSLRLKLETVDDSDVEPTETFSLSTQVLNWPAKSTTPATATYSILNNDGVPTIRPGDLNGIMTGQVTVYEQGLTSNLDTSETVSGAIQINSTSAIQSVTIGNTSLTVAQLAGVLTTPIEITTSRGRLRLISYSGNSLVGSIGYVYTLQSPIGQAGSDSSIDAIPLTVLAQDGNSASDTLVVLIIDDKPTAVATATTAVSLPPLLLDESATISGDGIRSVSASFSANFDADLTVPGVQNNYGADGPGFASYAVSLSADGIPSGLFTRDPADTSTGDGDGIGQGQPIILKLGLDLDTGVIIGSANNGIADIEYFRISVSSSGVITFSQSVDANRSIWHNNTTSADEPVSISLGGDSFIRLTQTLTDADGDTSAPSQILASSTSPPIFFIQDDGPTAVTSSSLAPGSLVLDESATISADGLRSASLSFAANFDADPNTPGLQSNFGADGAGTATYTLSLSSDGISSGLFARNSADTSSNDGDGIGQGQPILLKMGTGNNAGVLIGYVTISNTDVEYFRISIDTAGLLTFSQTVDASRSIWQANTGNADDAASITLPTGSFIRLTQTLSDADGDQSSASFNIVSGSGATPVFTIQDDGPTAANAAPATPVTITLDESSARVAGVRSATGSFADHFSSATSIYGSDGPGSITYSLNLTGSNLPSGLFSLDPSDTLSTDGDAIGQGNPILLNKVGNDIVGTVGNSEAIRLSLNTTTGLITFSQTTNIWHPNPANPDESASLSLSQGSLSLVQTVSDADGDSSTATYDLGTNNRLTIRDDAPAAANAAPATPVTITLDETSPRVGGVRSATGSFGDHFSSASSVYGSDGPGSISYSFSLNGSNVPSGLFALDPADVVSFDNDGIGQGNPILLNKVGNDIVGSSGANEVIRLSLNLTTGLVTFSQSANIWHPNAASPDDSLSLTLAAGTLNLLQTVTDADGDTSSASFDLGANNRLNIRDDGPGPLNVVPATPVSISLDESSSLIGGVRSGSGNFADYFASTNAIYGSDGAGSITYTLNLSGNIVLSSGLFALDLADTLSNDGDGVGQGNPILLNKVANDIVGTVGTNEYFRISVNSATGQVSFSQSANIWHSNSANPDDSTSISLTAGSLTLVQTVNDVDGDSSSTSFDLGTNNRLAIRDDGPTVTANTVAPIDTLTVDEFTLNLDANASFADNFSSAINYGSDGPGGTAYSLVLNGTNVASGLFTPGVGISPGNPILLNQNGNTITGSAGGSAYFTITINPLTGVVTLDQLAEIYHANADLPTSLNTAPGTLVLRTTVTDADGDSLPFNLDVGSAGAFRFKDDGPLIISSVTVNEGSPFAVFTISGTANQQLRLSLADQNNDGVDLSRIETLQNGQWSSYTAASLTNLTPSGTLLVRVAIDPEQDTAVDGPETFSLVATNSANRSFQGIGTIRDDGSGSYFGPTNTTSTSNPGSITLDDDRPLAVASVTVNEGSPFAVFTISGTANQLLRLSLADQNSDGSDLSRLDVLINDQWVTYTTNSTVPIGANNSLLVRVAIDPEQELIVDGPETFSLVATNTGGQSHKGTGTILDDGRGSYFAANNKTASSELNGATLDDDRPLNVSNVTVNEGSPYAVFSVTGAPDQPLRLTLTDQNNDAVNLSTIEVLQNGQWIPYTPGALLALDTAGSLLARVAITPEQDTALDGPESFSLAASNTNNRLFKGVGTIVDDGTGGYFAPANITATSNATGIILDDDRPLNVSSISINEGSPYGVFSITGSNNQLLRLSLTDQNNDGSDLTTLDVLINDQWVPYTANSIVAIGASESLLVRVAIDPEQELAVDGPETFSLLASNTGGQDYKGTGTILDDGRGSYFTANNKTASSALNGATLDDDRPLNVSSVTVNEGSPYAVFTISGSPDQPLRLTLTDQNNDGINLSTIEVLQNGQWISYTAGNLLALDAAGSLLARVAITPEQETTLDGPESFSLAASNANNRLFKGVGTIVDDGTGGYFAPTTITATSNASGVILDDDRPLNVSSISINEGSPYGVFSITGSNNQLLRLSLTDQNSDGTDLSSLDVLINDQWVPYTANSTVAIGASESLLVRVAIDPEQELAVDGPETFSLLATNTGGQGYKGTGTILDDGRGSYFTANNKTASSALNGATLDDDRPLNVSSVTVNEGSPYAVFTISGSPDQPLRLTLTDQNNDGINLSAIEVLQNGQWISYTAGNLLALDAAGSLLARVAITPEQETAVDGPETFSLTASNANNRLFNGVGTIVDDGTGGYFAASSTSSSSNPGGIALDDDRPLSVTSITVNEGSPFAVFTVSGTANQLLRLSLADQNSDGSDLSRLDVLINDQWVTYTANSTVPIGATNSLLVRVAIDPEQELVVDGPETFSLVATNTGGQSHKGSGTILDDGRGNYFAANNKTTNSELNGAVLDDDRPLNVSSVTVNEGSPYAVFTISGSPDQPLRLTLTDQNNDGINLSTIEVLQNGQWISYTAGNLMALDATGSLLARVAITPEQETTLDGPESFSLAASNANNRMFKGVGTIVDDGTGGYFAPTTITATSNTSGVILDDDRPLNISSISINEGSPYGVFSITGGNNQLLRLSLTDQNSDGSDLTTLELLLNGQWTPYSPGDLSSLNGSGSLLARVAISPEQETTLDCPESFSLAATNTGDQIYKGTGTILDAGNGNYYAADNRSATPSTPAGIILDDDRPLLKLTLDSQTNSSELADLTTSDGNPTLWLSAPANRGDKITLVGVLGGVLPTSTYRVQEFVEPSRPWRSVYKISLFDSNTGRNGDQAYGDYLLGIRTDNVPNVGDGQYTVLFEDAEAGRFLIQTVRPFPGCLQLVFGKRVAPTLADAEALGDSVDTSPFGYRGTPKVVGTNTDNNLFGENTKSDSLNGRGGSDVLNGVGDRITGQTYNPNTSDPNIRNQVDTLIGGKGNDVFQLGDSIGSFYTLSTSNDYATIRDFERTDDLILYGRQDMYKALYTPARRGRAAQLSIFYENQGSSDLIAVVQGSGLAPLARLNANSASSNYMPALANLGHLIFT